MDDDPCGFIINEGWVRMRQAPLTANIIEAEVRLLARDGLESWIPHWVF